MERRRPATGRDRVSFPAGRQRTFLQRCRRRLCTVLHSRVDRHTENLLMDALISAEKTAQFVRHAFAWECVFKQFVQTFAAQERK